MATINLPAACDGLGVVASVSGGKDSTALICALRESGINARYVFADTGWEANETYEYIELLRVRLGITIDVVHAKAKREPEPGEKFSAMVDRVRHRAGFPSGMRRWCTRELKIEPLRAYHDDLEEKIGAEFVSAVGIRSDESASRSAMPELSDDPEWGGWVWRPLIAWTVEDVLMAHHRHGIPVNPLYQRGHNRVGCYPCIYSSKEEIRIIAENSPDRIDLVRELENWSTAERAIRNIEKPGRYSWPVASFFQMRDRVKAPPGEESTIDNVVAWSRTPRGGVSSLQEEMFAPRPTGGCMKWGLCEVEPKATPIADSARAFFDELQARLMNGEY